MQICRLKNVYSWIFFQTGLQTHNFELESRKGYVINSFYIWQKTNLAMKARHKSNAV